MIKKLLTCSLVVVMSCGPKSESHKVEAAYDPYEHIENDQVRTILRKAIDKAGGYEKWSSLKTIEYTKHNMLFLEDGTTEVDNIQRHEYTMRPEFKVRITWEKENVNHLITYGPEGGKRYRHDSLTTQDPTETVMSAIYVLGMPFKLLDAGTRLEHRGQVRLESGEIADEIKATYDPGENENHSTQDEWYYYFGADGTFFGAMVYHAPTYAYIRNLEFDTSTPIQFHKHRKSYRSDSSRNIQFLRAEFWYADYQVTYE